MPQVYNWQLGRKMLYPYEERHPKWQFTFVFNINRCIACQTCSMADKSTWLFSKGQEYMWWNNVETKPYGGYPQFYDVKVAQLVEQVNPGGQVWNTRVGRKHHAPYGVFEGFTIFDAGAKIGQAAIGYIPTDQEWRFVNIYEDTATSMRALVDGNDTSGFAATEPGHDAGLGEVHCVLSAGGGEGPLDRRGADGDAVHGGVRGQNPAAGPGEGRGGRPVGGGPVAPAVLRDSGGAGGVAAVPAVGDG